MTKPSVSPSATALPLAVNGNLPTVTSRPFSRGLRLRRADRGDLRTAVGARRDVAVVDGPRALAGDRLGRHDALGHGLVREQRRARHVADRVDALHRRLHVGETFTKPRSICDAERLEPEARHLRRAADGHQHLLDLELAAVGLTRRRRRRASPTRP